jgi:hypothetical protein
MVLPYVKSQPFVSPAPAKLVFPDLLSDVPSNIDAGDEGALLDGSRLPGSALIEKETSLMPTEKSFCKDY